MDTQRLEELLIAWEENALTVEEIAELKHLLATEPQARRRLVEAGVFQSVAETQLQAWATLQPASAMPTTGGRQKASGFAWLSWRPLTAAAAGIALGMFCTSVFSAYAAPRAVATMTRLLAIMDGSFEKSSAPVAAGFPATPGVWSGDPAQIVDNGNGAVPAREGQRMLRFLRADREAAISTNPAEACDVYQLVDLRALHGQPNTKATGDSILELSAEFLDARTAAGEPIIFACHLYLFEGSAESLQAVWPPTAQDTLGVGANYVRSSGGAETAGWHKVTASCVLNPRADFAVVKLSVGRSIERGNRRGGPAPELGSQFADDVQLVLKTQPALPVRIVHD